ncbi:MAG TPA: 3D domain-containing protein [Pyrinomonadaceae bacterium]|jgi:3D (Asp-Asp-Asp) domain-containing protein
MSRPLIGGSAAAAVLLSASVLFLAQTSVAEPLGQIPQEVRQQNAAAETTESQAAAAETADNADAATQETPKAAVDNKEKGAEAAAVTPHVTYTATAYSLRGRTASGGAVRRGVIAADRRVLPLGTRVRLEAGSYSGEYVVADTGGAVRGRKIDIWVPHTSEAMRFGRRPVKLTVLTRTRPRTATLRPGM